MVKGLQYFIQPTPIYFSVNILENEKNKSLES